MRAETAAAAALGLLALTLPTLPRAQIDMGPPGLLGNGGLEDRQRDQRDKERREKDKRERRMAVAPFATALYDAFSPAEWTAIHLSTASPREELSRLLREGTYRQELVLLVLAAKESGRPLRKLIEKRADGDTLRSIVEGLRLDYAKLFDQSAELKEKLDRRAAVIEAESPHAEPLSVSSAPAVAPSTAPAAAPR